MKLNTENNLYTILYIVVVVIVVAFLLAFSYSGLKSRSDANERINKKEQILAALNLRNLPKDSVDAVYKQVVVSDLVISADGQVVKKGEKQDQDGFQIERKAFSKDNLPLYICQIDGDTKYVLPMVGKGLWGSIWGFISVNADGKTVYGAYFAHESETAGLGAIINEPSFQNQFQGKLIATAEGDTLQVVKSGAANNEPTKCDGVTGATLTSNGVNMMIHTYLYYYLPYLNSLNNPQ